MSDRYLPSNFIKRYTPDDYINMVGKAVEEVFKNEDCLVIFFGSVARGDMKRTSDIDVGIYCKGGIDPVLYTRLEKRIEELPILRRVEIVDLNRVYDSDFLQNILKEGKIWKGSKDLLKDLERRLASLKKS